MSQLFAPGGQSIGDSASAAVLPVNIQGGFRLGFISLQSKGLSSEGSKEVEEPFLFGQTKKGIMEEEVFLLTGGQRNSDELGWGGISSLRGGGGQAVW